MQNEKKKVQLKIKKALNGLSNPGGMLKGTVSKVVLGKKKKGKGMRECYLLTYKGNGNKTKTVYVNKNSVATVRIMLANYKKAKRILDQIVELNVRLFKIM